MPASDRDRPVTCHATTDGRRVYRLPLEVFPGFWGNAYVVTGGERPVLVDCGSGQEASNADLERTFAEIGERFDEPLAWSDLGAILITHAHIDHFGGLHRVRERCAAPIHIHVLDRRVLSHYEERLVVAAKQVERFLAGAGVPKLKRFALMQMYQLTKRLFTSLPAETSFEEGPLLGGEVEALHVPGHCPGQVCLRFADVLLTADHVLAKISPHLSPEAITFHNGLSHYFASLKRLDGVEVSVGLGGHQGPIADVLARAEEIRRLYDRRLGQVLDFCREPRTVREVSKEIFGTQHTYHALLALLEAGAYVEYLYQRGELVVVNVREVEKKADPVMRYQRP